MFRHLYSIQRFHKTSFGGAIKEGLSCLHPFEQCYVCLLYTSLYEADKIGNGLQVIRGRDCNLVSNMLVDGCIENAKSVTQGGTDTYIAVGALIGISNVIDSLSVTKQLVFDEKRITMKQLIEALKNNWSGFEELREYVLKKGKFFGNDEPCSNDIAHRLSLIHIFKMLFNRIRQVFFRN